MPVIMQEACLWNKRCLLEVTVPALLIKAYPVCSGAAVFLLVGGRSPKMPVALAPNTRWEMLVRFHSLYGLIALID